MINTWEVYKMTKRLDLVGQRFGRLEVIEFAGMNKFSKSLWLCLCDCGNYTTTLGSCLLNGHTKSCGCWVKQDSYYLKHGNTKHNKPTKEYTIWANMCVRCRDNKNKQYADYGGRGIIVCERWLGEHGFEDFLADMGKCPDGKSLDRIDNNGNYEPGNCRWVTQREQCNNTRRNRWVTLNGERLTLTQAARKLGVVRSSLSDRLNNGGWSEEKALTTPYKSRCA
jgi:hypothetical protein